MLLHLDQVGIKSKNYGLVYYLLAYVYLFRNKLNTCLKNLLDFSIRLCNTSLAIWLQMSSAPREASSLIFPVTDYIGTIIPIILKCFCLHTCMVTCILKKLLKTKYG